MKSYKLKSAVLSMFLLAGISIAGAATVTVGPSGQYPDPCTAFNNLQDGDTVLIDANGGTPYEEPVQPGSSYSDCQINNNNLTIVGVNGRPVLDGSNSYVGKGIWVTNGHDIVIDNFEFRNARNGPSNNSEAIRIQNSNGNATPDGGNITLQHSYIHDDNTGILSENASGPGSGLEWYSANPYITFQYDEFANCGNADQQGNTHNIYMGFDLSGAMDFTFQYSWTHDSYVGHTLKTREPINNILYNMVTDELGNTSYLLDFCLGGSTYVVGNSLYKSAATNGNNNYAMMIFADVTDNTSSDPEYGVPHQDLHFINNSVVDDPYNNFPSQFVSISCFNSDNSTCPAPDNGPAVTTPAVIENNIFVGQAGNAVTNQTSAYVKNNIVQTYSASQLAADFVDFMNYDFHLVSGSPAIGAGLYPPTDNTGAADPKALAVYEYVHPNGAVARPTPSGNTMDVGAYSYPRVDTPPTLNLSYTTTVTAPGSGTITITGLPTPPSGSYNFAAFKSENTAAIPTPTSTDSTTGTITATFTVNSSVTQSTVVPIDVYADGAHAVANVTVNPGPPVLVSITEDGQYNPASTVHLAGPAPAGGTVINLSSSDPTYISVPATVTVPAGQISAETGSNTGSLWGQNPFLATETITATQGDITESTQVSVFTAGNHACNWDQASVIGGQTANYFEVNRGGCPNGGCPIYFTSDNPAVIPNQTQTISAFFYGDIPVMTNPVSTATVVNVGINLNGDTDQDNTGGSCTVPITVEPGGGTTPPAPPTNLVATATSFQPVNLTWTASPTAGIGYNLYRSTTSGFSPDSSNLIQSGLSGTSYADYTVAASTTYYYVLEAVDLAGSSSPSNQATVTTTAEPAATDLLDIDAGGPAAGSYVADEYYTGGATYGVTNTIDTSLIPNPGPQAVYQNQRYNANGGTTFSYTIPGLTPGQNYIVRLQFVEQYYTSEGAREFNVVINGVQVLTNFDVYAAAGDAAYKAVEKDFEFAADQNGQINIQFNNGAVDNALVNAVSIASIQTGNPTLSAVTQDQSGFAQTTVHLSEPAPSDTVVQLSSSNPSVVYAPASVTIPAGQSSAEAGTLLGGLWGQYPSSKSATITATYNGTSKSVLVTVAPPTVSDFSVVSVTCTKAPCDTLHGGNTYTVTLSLAGNAPVGGAPVSLTSSNTAVVQNTSGTFSVGSGSTGTATLTLTTGTVTKATYVQLTEHFNGQVANVSETVQP